MFTVTAPRAPRFAIRPDIRRMAAQLAADAADRTPVESGEMRAGYRVVPGRDPGTSIVTNPVPYARYVEYGTRYRPASAPLGQAAAYARSRVR